MKKPYVAEIKEMIKSPIFKWILTKFDYNLKELRNYETGEEAMVNKKAREIIENILNEIYAIGEFEEIAGDDEESIKKFQALRDSQLQ